MRLEELNWMDVESYLTEEDRIILVLGATEQHGYLSLLTDVKIPQALADAASASTGVLVAPPLNFGVSPYFSTYPGTISLRTSTFLAVVEDIVRSLYGVGFRRIFIMNGHGGNSGVRTRLTELANEMDGLKFVWYSWWESHSIEAIAMKHELKTAHANWMEAFPFTRVANLPADAKIPPKVIGVPNAEETRALYGDGMFGGAYLASGEIMDEVFAAALADILEFIQF
ncbi:MAG: creatininase family protein [Chloroflexi bacterium]|nr:MAG: creatininase family protein [Chloroflexota bacterium]